MRRVCGVYPLRRRMPSRAHASGRGPRPGSRQAAVPDAVSGDDDVLAVLDAMFCIRSLARSTLLRSFCVRPPVATAWRLAVAAVRRIPGTGGPLLAGGAVACGLLFRCIRSGLVVPALEWGSGAGLVRAARRRSCCSAVRRRGVSCWRPSPSFRIRRRRLAGAALRLAVDGRCGERVDRACALHAAREPGAMRLGWSLVHAACPLESCRSVVAAIRY